MSNPAEKSADSDPDDAAADAAFEKMLEDAARRTRPNIEKIRRAAAGGADGPTGEEIDAALEKLLNGPRD